MIEQELDTIQWLEFKLFQPYEPFAKLEIALYEEPAPEDGSISTKSMAKAIDEGISSHYSAPPRVESVSSFAKGSYAQIRHACFTSSLPIIPPLTLHSSASKCIQKILLQGQQGSLAAMHQVHGTALQFVEDGYDRDLPCDAIATNRLNTILVVQHADCQPCLFFDPVCGVIAAIHSGWRGSVQNVYKGTVAALQQRYGCKPKDIHAGIGPSLGPQHAQFIHHEHELPQNFLAYQAGDRLFDFWASSRDQLLACGLEEKHIEIARICTYKEHDRFFSYRKNKTSMRNASCIALIQKPS